MAGKGHVTLVGAGPGDPGLITVAGRAALTAAEVILHDRLVGEEILAMIPSRAERIDVGKRKGNHPVPQQEINRLILAHALAGRRVVRLKGGDPYLFGRGAEELEAVAAAGIPFTVVPGVSSALAVPACAGIPVTHRGLSSSVHILTGHGRDGKEAAIPYGELARLGGTLVFLMGLSEAGTICRRLVEEGLPGDTPAAAVEHGTRPEQRRLAATLATLPQLLREEEVSSPAVLIVGAVCALGERLDPAVHLPLHGRRVLAVSSRATAGRLAATLREYGVAVDEFAAIGMEAIPLPKGFWPELPSHAWMVFTSRFGVETFFAAMGAARIDVRTLGGMAIASVGRETAAALADRTLHADLVPAEYNGESLGRELAGRVQPGTRVLLFRAEAGSADLPDLLRRSGMAVEDVPAYRTFPRTLPEEYRRRFEAGGYDAVTFTSGLAVDSFARAVAGESVTGKRAFCIGERTAAAAGAAGFRVEISPEATVEALARMMAERMVTE